MTLAMAITGASWGPAQAASTAPSPVLDRTLTDSRIRESSGLSRSTYARPVLFTHNDSGDSARFFAVDQAGDTVAVLTLEGATARDWEDISSGPDHTQWLGDIGDNAQARDHVSVYRVTEPASLSSGPVAWTRYDFVYPDGPHNAESLMVQPKTGRVFIVSKSRTGAAIYRAPAALSTTSDNELEKLGPAPMLATGAAFFPDGDRLVIRNHNWAYVYSQLGDTPTALRLPAQRQGESVEVTADSSALLVGSEGVDSPVDRVTL